MTACAFDGLVKANKPKVLQALSNFSRTKKEAEEIYLGLRQRSKGETKLVWFFLWRKRVTVESLLKQQWRNSWRQLYEVYGSHYRGSLNEIHSEVLDTYNKTGEVLSRMVEHSDEFYLTPQQIKWVSRWEGV